MALQKVFRLELVGSREMEAGARRIADAYRRMADQVRAAKLELLRTAATGDSAATDALTQKVRDLESAMRGLKAERSTAEKQAKAQAQAEKLLADAKLKEAQATKAQAQADEARTRSLIAQEKELDRQIERQERASRRRRPQAAPGTVGDFRDQYNAFRQQVINGVQVGTPEYDAAILKLRQLKAAVDDFGRSMSKDGTLVGEYTTGIIQAFKRMGIDDIIRGQVNGGKQELEKLKQKTNELVVAYRQAQATGAAGMNALEAEIRDNVEQTQALSRSIQQAEAQLAGMGGIGTQITTGLKQSFKDLKNQVGQFVLGYFGFQAAFSGINKAFTNTVQLDGLDKAMTLVSGNTKELATNQRFLADVTQRLGLEYIGTTEAFKNFYASATQAGISGEETRRIFESASQAAASLGLSGEQTNGVLLAFGQIASKGKVQAEELRGQIGERLPGAFSIAARAMGVTQAQLNKMLENGEVLSNEFLPKFATELRKTFGGTTQGEVQTLQATVNRFKNELTDLIQDNQPALRTFFQLIIQLGSAFFGLLRYLPQIGIALAVLAAGWVAGNTALVIANAQILLYNLQIAGSYIALGALTVAQLAYNAVMLVFNGTLRVVTAGLRVFGITAATATGPLGIILTLVGLLGAAFVAFGREANAASLGVSNLIRSKQSLIDVQRKAAQQIAEETAELNKNFRVATSQVASADARRNAIQALIDKYPEYFSKLNAETASVQQLTEAYNKATNAIRQKAFAQASADLAADAQKRVNEVAALELVLGTENAAQKGLTRKVSGLSPEQQALLEQIADPGRNSLRVSDGTVVFTANDYKLIQSGLSKLREQREQTAQDYEKIAAANAPKLTGGGGGDTGPGGRTIEAIKKDLEKANADWEKSIVGSKAKADLKRKIDALQAELDAATGKKGRTPGASKLSAGQKDGFKDIDAERARLIAELEKARLVGGQFNNLLIDTEERYLRELLGINLSAIEQKQALLKGSNAEERKQLAELGLEKLKLQRDTDQKLFELANASLERTLQARNNNAEATLSLTGLNPNLTASQRVQAQEEYYTGLLQNQLQFNADQASLEQRYGQQSEENEQKRTDAVLEIRRKLQALTKDGAEAEITDIKRTADTQITEYNINYSKLRQAILNNEKLTADQKKAQIERLNRLQNVTILSAELAKVNIEVEALKKQYDKGLIDRQTYLDAVQRQNEASEKLQEGKEGLNAAKINLPGSGAAQKLLSGELSKAFGFGEDSAEGQLLGEVIAQGFNLATEAMNAYFDAQAQRVEQEKQQQLDALNREKERRLSRAQSAAEEDAINREFAQKQRNAEREAGERLKRVKKAEARMALLSELGNIAAAAAANPANAFTFGAAGTIMYGILSGLALGRYAMRVGEINAQQFAGGGKVQPLGSGRINVAPNMRSLSNGDNVLATVRTGEVILNEAQQRALGGPGVFRALGVPGFGSGGYVAPAMWGSRLKAPMFTASSFSGYRQNASDTEKIERLEALTEKLMATVAATDRKQVILNTSSVSRAQDRNRKDVDLGTI